MHRSCVSSLLLTASLAACAHAGPLFDDYLNYVRPGPGTPPGKSAAVAQTGKPLGQSFTAAKNVGEIYRIGLRPVYDTWAPGEQVTLTLYAAPDRRQKLAEYTIDEASSHVQPIYNTEDRVLYWHLRAPTKGRNSFFFTIEPKGGDGRVSFQAMRDVSGTARGAVKSADLSYLVHIKPAADREANLREFFTKRMDIERPELAAVKAAVEARDWEKAIAAAAQHFHERKDTLSDYAGALQEKPKLDADTELADLLIHNRRRHVETKQPVAWRPEDDWIAEYKTERAEPKHAADPNLATWHVDRCLAAAYSNTGKPEYARRCIDLRMQFILDNPSPKVSGLPWYFELWNDRTAAARAPGHAFLPYARLYKYDGWTADERLIFFAFLEDSARWDYQADSGANWGAEASRACYEFGLKFPEWKMSAEYVRWGTNRLAEIVLADVRGDGTSSEAAIKYHSMVARRLKGMLADHVEGRIKLDDAVLPRLMKAVEGMYEHMAYTRMPNGYVVMCGDSWYEDFGNELKDVGLLVHRPDFIWIATQGAEGSPPVEISKMFPGGGYFIMRSDFGSPAAATKPASEREKAGKRASGRTAGRDAARSYHDSTQLFIHNGNWFGSHGHYDLTSVNLYAFGRPLIIDPGQYDHEPPAGINHYWESKIHAMLVPDGRDCKRDVGPSEWASSDIADFFDGRHFGYRKSDDIGAVRRRILFVKPDYFIVDDSAESQKPHEWAQVWNLTDPSAVAEQGGAVLATTFATGGNLLILNASGGRASRSPASTFSVEMQDGITSTKEEIPKTRIVRLKTSTDTPRFQTLVYPYIGSSRPTINWHVTEPADAKSDALSYAATIDSPVGHDWIAFGQHGNTTQFAGRHAINADAVVVRGSDAATPAAFAWMQGRLLTFTGRTLAAADAPVHALAVQYDAGRLLVDAPEAEPTLRILATDVKQIMLSGKPVEKPAIRDGFYYPFAGQPLFIVADNRDAFATITKTDEWQTLADPAAWAGSYIQHETDPGRHESGIYTLEVPAAGRYRLEAYLPKVTVNPSDRVDYAFMAEGQLVVAGGAVVASRSSGRNHVVTVNQQSMAGWVNLGEFNMKKGRFTVTARNVTSVDGLYFIADAVRLVVQR